MATNNAAINDQAVRMSKEDLELNKAKFYVEMESIIHQESLRVRLLTRL
jgi:hypothetical protein